MKEKLTALIVDDETDVCFLLSGILTNKDFQTICVNSIEEARKCLSTNVPSIVFLDNHLPDGFGVNFIGEIKRLLPDVKVVMITAYDTKSDKDKAHLEGVDYFIGKPFTRDSIFHAIESTLNMSGVKM